MHACIYALHGRVAKASCLRLDMVCVVKCVLRQLGLLLGHLAHMVAVYMTCLGLEVVKAVYVCTVVHSGFD